MPSGYQGQSIRNRIKERDRESRVHNSPPCRIYPGPRSSTYAPEGTRRCKEGREEVEKDGGRGYEEEEEEEAGGGVRTTHHTGYLGRFGSF